MDQGAFTWMGFSVEGSNDYFFTCNTELMHLKL